MSTNDDYFDFIPPGRGETSTRATPHVQEERQRLVELQYEEQRQEAALQALRQEVVAAGADPTPLDIVSGRCKRASHRLAGCV